MRYGLKERLLGAAVLIALLVVFVPFVVQEPTPQLVSEKILTPPAPEPIQHELEQPVRPELPPALTTQQQRQAQELSSQLDSGLSLQVEGGVQVWAIQVATLGSSDSAKNLVARLEQESYQAYWRKINGMSVVFTGPYLNHQLALEHQHQLLATHQLQTLVTGYIPEHLARQQGSLPTADD